MLSPNLNIDFMGGRRIALGVSAVVIFFALGSLFTRGLNFGLDFTGGTLVEVVYSQAVEQGKARSLSFQPAH